MGLDQYVASGCDRCVGWATKLGRVVNVTWLLTIDELSTSDRVIGHQHSIMGIKMLEWLKEDQIWYRTRIYTRMEKV
jgi:hypothetical protein